MRGGARAAALTAALGLAAGAAYARWLKPYHDRWGASLDEVEAELPGDDLCPDAAGQVTRAISIDASPADVWPWLLQIGADRGGFYSYDWLENLFGLRIHSADRIVEHWQRLAVGDLVYASAGRTGGWSVAAIVPERALVLQAADVRTGRPLRRQEPPGWEFQWTFALRAYDDRWTRLLVRERVAFGNRCMRFFMAPVETVSFVMTRRMLIGIKERAEKAARRAEQDVVTSAADRGTYDPADAPTDVE